MNTALVRSGTSSEAERIAAIEVYTASNAIEPHQFDTVIELTKRIFDVRNIFISTVHETKQVFHCSTGIFVEEMEREFSFCNHTIETDKILVIPDTVADERFRNHPLVTGQPYVRFYAGAPLITPGGHRIGTLCITDTISRSFTYSQCETLQNLASFVVERLEILRLNHFAKFDSLTQLYNRETLLTRMKLSFATSQQSSALLIDLDGFKEINDTLGHPLGDRLLQIVSERVKACCGAHDVAARLGGDELVVFVDGLGDPILAKGLAERVLSAIRAPIEIDGNQLLIDASIGIALRTNGVSEPTQLLGNADLALYQAKASGRGCARMFTHELRRNALDSGNLSLELQDAWDTRDFELYYQPQVDLISGKWIGAEALIRWNYPYQGLIFPAAFLPVLERSRLVLPVGEWIIRTACAQAAHWRRKGIARFRIGVNLFAAQFRNDDLASIVERALSDHGLPAEALVLEITENIILRHEKKLREQLMCLKSSGVGLALDDFGTGFASLSMLKDFPVTTLKIDRSFVRTIERSKRDQSIVHAIIDLARELDLHVVAEGIETQEQFALLRDYGCHEGQGYLFSRPMTARDFERNVKAIAFNFDHVSTPKAG